MKFDIRLFEKYGSEFMSFVKNWSSGSYIFVVGVNQGCRESIQPF